MEDPRRRKLRRLTAEPKVPKSSAESEEPILAMPYVDMELPIRTKLRKDKHDPSARKSSMDTAEARRAVPKMLIDEPRRAKLRRENVDPSCRKSMIETEDPRRDLRKARRAGFNDQNTLAHREVPGNPYIVLSTLKSVRLPSDTHQFTTRI